LSSPSDSNDVQQAISLRQKYFDPLGYGLVIVRVKEPLGIVSRQFCQKISFLASNLAQLQTFGIFDLPDTNFIHEITSSVCQGRNYRVRRPSGFLVFFTRIWNPKFFLKMVPP
jgi:hypothetical protein